MHTLIVFLLAVIVIELGVLISAAREGEFTDGQILQVLEEILAALQSKPNQAVALKFTLGSPVKQ